MKDSISLILFLIEGFVHFRVDTLEFSLIYFTNSLGKSITNYSPVVVLLVESFVQGKL